MKRFAACLLFLICGLSGCAWKQQLPVPAPLGSKALESEPGIFPVGRWQFVHAIDFSMDNRDGATVIGIVRLDESGLDVALVTVEGLTLFEAGREDGQEPVIRRAVLPFGSQGFAASLLADVEMIFRAPAGRPSLGRSPGGEQVWQYLSVGGERTDILPREAGCWRLSRYDPAGRLQRQLEATQCREEAGFLLPGFIELNAEPAGYHLRMRLISATRLQDA